MSDLELKIKVRIKECQKSGDTFELCILRTIIGETHRLRNHEVSDNDIEKIIRKMREGCMEIVKLTHDPHSRFVKEVEIYDSYLEPTMDINDIIDKLDDIHKAICESKSNGQAIGLAMQHLKKNGCKVLGQDVADAIRSFRD